MGEPVEITIVIGEKKLRDMLNQLREAKNNGLESVIVEDGDINFHIYVTESEKLMKFDEKHGN